jgi:hypothetical protein
VTRTVSLNLEENQRYYERVLEKVEVKKSP